MSNLVAHNIANPCPVCQGTNGKCKTDRHNGVVLCGTEGEDTGAETGRTVVDCSDGVERVFVKQTDEYATWKPEEGQDIDRLLKTLGGSGRTTSSSNRGRNREADVKSTHSLEWYKFSQGVAKLNRVADLECFVDELNERCGKGGKDPENAYKPASYWADEYGLTCIRHNDQVSEPGIKCAGVDARGIYKGVSGLLLPLKAPTGTVMGYQVMPGKGKRDNGKYQFLPGGVNGYNYLVGDGDLNESPVTFVLDTPDPAAITELYLMEGVLKPIIARERLGISCVGAPSGWFYKSPRLLELMLNQFPNLSRLVYTPDAGSMGNQQVKKTDEKNISLLTKLTNGSGIEILVAYWGQGEGKPQPHEKSTKGDIDEVSGDTYLHEITFLQPSEYTDLTLSRTVSCYTVIRDGCVDDFEDEPKHNTGFYSHVFTTADNNYAVDIPNGSGFDEVLSDTGVLITRLNTRTTLCKTSHDKRELKHFLDTRLDTLARNPDWERKVIITHDLVDNKNNAGVMRAVIKANSDITFHVAALNGSDQVVNLERAWSLIMLLDTAIPNNECKALLSTRGKPDERYLADVIKGDNDRIPDLGKLIVLTGAQGSGKTQAVREYLEDYNHPVLTICHRRSLSGQQSTDFGTNDVSRAKAGAIKSSSRLSCCIDSLLKIPLENYPENGYVVFIDEFRQVMQHLLTSPTDVKNQRAEIIERLEAIVRGADVVIVADKDYTGGELELLENIADKPVDAIYKSAFQPKSGVPLQFLPNPESVLLRFVDEIKTQMSKPVSERRLVYAAVSGQKVSSTFGAKVLEQVAFDTIRQCVENGCEPFPDMGVSSVVGVIDSETHNNPDSAAYRACSDIIKYVCNKLVLIASPTMGTGVSIPDSVECAGIFVFTTGNHNPEGVVQHTERIRYPARVYTHARTNPCLNAVLGGATTSEGFKSQLIAKTGQANDLNNGDVEALREVFSSSNSGYWMDYAVSRGITHNAMIKNYRVSLKLKFSEIGYVITTVEDYDKQEVNQIKQYLKGIKTRLVEGDIEDHIKAPVTSHEEYLQLIDKQEPTHEEVMMAKSHSLLRAVLPEPGDELDELDNPFTETEFGSLYDFKHGGDLHKLTNLFNVLHIDVIRLLNARKTPKDDLASIVFALDSSEEQARLNTLSLCGGSSLAYLAYTSWVTGEDVTIDEELADLVEREFKRERRNKRSTGLMPSTQGGKSKNPGVKAIALQFGCKASRVRVKGSHRKDPKGLVLRANTPKSPFLQNVKVNGLVGLFRIWEDKLASRVEKLDQMKRANAVMDVGGESPVGLPKGYRDYTNLSRLDRALVSYYAGVDTDSKLLSMFGGAYSDGLIDDATVNSWANKNWRTTGGMLSLKSYKGVVGHDPEADPDGSIQSDAFIGFEKLSLALDPCNKPQSTEMVKLALQDLDLPF